MNYILNYCQNTYDFLMQNEEYAYRLTKEIIEQRNKRLINGPKIKFYHKTTSTAAGSIINYQTFFRSERGGFFGNGIYFCSNPNSTHNKSNPSETKQTILESEVLVGKILLHKGSANNYTFGDLISKKCDSLRATYLKDDEYIIFCQDQICSIKDYMDPVGFWGYKSGKQQLLVLGHDVKQLNQITHHPNWYPFKSRGSKATRKTLVVNFNGPNAKIIPPITWTGNEDDLYNIYKKNIKGKTNIFTKKNTKLNKDLLSKGYANPSQPLSKKLFLKLINNNLNKICINNKSPSFLKDI